MAPAMLEARQPNGKRHHLLAVHAGDPSTLKPMPRCTFVRDVDTECANIGAPFQVQWIQTETLNIIVGAASDAMWGRDVFSESKQNSPRKCVVLPGQGKPKSSCVHGCTL